MRVTLLHALDDEALGGRLGAALAERGVEVRAHDLAHERFSPCVGCFRCWVVHPGSCRARDAGNAMLADLAASDVVLWTTRPRWGCWDPLAKAALDKMIGLISPFFATIDGETHHAARYRSLPRFVVLADDADSPTRQDREAFDRLVARNALNLQDRRPQVIWSSTGEDPVHRAVQAVLHEPDSSTDVRVEALMAGGSAAPASRRGTPQALVLVCSAKPPGESTSERLGEALGRRLEARGWTVARRTLAHDLGPGRPPSVMLLSALKQADLVVLATPVYVDCLPAVVVRLLHYLAAHPLDGHTVLLPLVQCGFPEAAHTGLATRILQSFATDVGWGWAGALATGQGGGLMGAGGQLRLPDHTQALDEAADALTRGQPLSADTITRFSQPVMAAGTYRFLGNLGWLAQAWKHGALLDLWDQPFDGGGDGANA